MVYEWKAYDCISEFNPYFEIQDSNANFYALVAQLTMLYKVIKA